MAAKMLVLFTLLSREQESTDYLVHLAAKFLS